MRNKKGLLLPLLLCSILFVLSNNSVRADDPGITKVRLIQQSDTTYLFEADVPQLVLSSIKKPVLPERFAYSEFELENQSGWITLRTTITTSGRPFNREDEILLPWLRNGVDFTAQWKDGSTFKGLFNRTLKGIHIPMSEVMPTTKTTAEVLYEGMMMGVKHLSFKVVHIVFITSLVWLMGSTGNLGTLLWWSLGQSLAMIWGELGLPGVDLIFSDLLLLLLSLIMAYSIVYRTKFSYLWVALLISGLMHGASFLHELSDYPYSGLQKIQALFAFNMVLDLFQFGVAIVASLFLSFLKKHLQERKFAIGVGAASVLLTLLIFSDHIFTAEFRILQEKDTNAQITRLPAPAQQSMQQVQRAAGIMTAPIMAYLSIEPYEVRQEVLVQAKDVISAWYPKMQEQVISLELQEALKEALIDSITDGASILLDQQVIEPVETEVNFVRMSRGGVYVREMPVEEPLGEGIIGITMIYDIPSFPKTADYEWNFFPGKIELVEGSIVDPYGTLTATLTENERTLKWKNRLSGFELPVVEPIPIQHYALPLLAIILWLGVLVYTFIIFLSKNQLRPKPVLIALIAVGIVVYPFQRSESRLPFLPDWKPSTERSSNILDDLLTNVYRAFDRRKEEDVYDRLAMSVTGEQLTQVYLSNRQAMALENRGGARARVDEVTMLEVYEVKSGSDNGFIADAAWTVRGSVNHFGHTHYRQNQYRALVTFVDDSSAWKISSIETIEEKRVY